MTSLPRHPIELDSAYSAPEEPIEEMVRAREPRIGEWVQGFYPVPNGDDGVRRGLYPFLGRVSEIRDGDYTHGGCVVDPWSRRQQAFGEPFFAPWCCIISRCPVNHYVLTEAA